MFCLSIQIRAFLYYANLFQEKWASNDNRLAEFMYRSYDEDNFKAFAKVYNYNPKGGAGFDKPNATLYAKPESKFWSPQALQLYQHNCKYINNINIDNNII